MPEAISLETLMQNLQQKPNNATIQQFCTNAIRVRFAAMDSAPPRKQMERAVHAALAACEAHLEDSGVMVETCALVAEALGGEPSLSKQAALGVCISDDATRILTEVLVQHVKIAKIVVLCCQCMDVMFASMDKLKKERRVATVSILLQAIAEHAHEPAVALAACVSVATILSEESSGAAGPAVTATVNETTGSHPLDLLVPVLRHQAVAKGKHVEKGLQVKGLAALAALAGFQEFRVHLVANGAIEIPLLLAQRSTSDADIAHGCIDVWTQLARCPEGQTAINQSGGIALIVAIMKKHTAVLAHQLAGTAALTVLADNDDNKLEVARAGGIEVLVSSAKAHQGSPELQTAVAEVFCILALSERNRVLIGAKGGIAVLLDAACKNGITEVRPIAGTALRREDEQLAQHVPLPGLH